MSERWKLFELRWVGRRAECGSTEVDSSSQNYAHETSSQDDELLALMASDRDLFEEHSNGTFSLDLSNPNTAQRLGEEISKFKNFGTK